jgi:hypothetical protein
VLSIRRGGHRTTTKTDIDTALEPGERIAIGAACKEAGKDCNNCIRCQCRFDHGTECLWGEEDLRQMREVKDRLWDGCQGQAEVEDKVKDLRTDVKIQMVGSEKKRPR